MRLNIHKGNGFDHIYDSFSWVSLGEITMISKTYFLYSEKHIQEKKVANKEVLL